MRVVFDTNIFASAFVLPGSQGDSALLKIVDGADQLIVSNPILDELLGALARKFSRDVDELSRIAVFLFEVGTFVQPRRRLKVLEDEADNRIIECAMAGKADAIVTGDKAMLGLREFKGIRILSLKGYLQSPQEFRQPF